MSDLLDQILFPMMLGTVLIIIVTLCLRLAEIISCFV